MRTWNFIRFSYNILIKTLLEGKIFQIRKRIVQFINIHVCIENMSSWSSVGCPNNNLFEDHHLGTIY